MRDTAYCKNCGQTCKPEKYKRPREDYDPWGQAFFTDFRSPCCKDQLVTEPVSDYCDMCGSTADCSVPDKDIERYTREWDMLLCPQCYKDLIDDKGHDLEYILGRAEYMEDR